MNVKHLRSICDETLNFDNLTALVGPNGSGKSSFLRALNLFHMEKLDVTEDDFYNRDTTKEIIITITFNQLSDEAKTHFSSYIRDEELVIEMVIQEAEDKFESIYYGSRLRNPNFDDIRKSNNVSNALKEYAKIQKDYGFPDCKTRKSVNEVLDSWESVNLNKCDFLRDEGQFFGFKGVGRGYLNKFIKFVHIPAVRDASLDANEGKNSALTELVKTTIREKLKQKIEIQEFENETRKKYEQIFGQNNPHEFSSMSESLTKILHNYVPDAKISLSWDPEFKLELPSAIANLIEDEYPASVENAGHGLQRAFIITMLQYLSTIKEENITEQSLDLPTVVLTIDEPELYQHPNRQRHLSKICIKLSEETTSTNTSKMQIVYCTHSPHFIGLDRIQQIRLLKKDKAKNNYPKITKIISVDIKTLVTKLNDLHRKKFSDKNISLLLHVVMTSLMNEGFFAKVVVLVEGDSDRAAILGTAEAMGIELESLGVSVIPCDSKYSMDTPAVVFREFKIPTYLIWDNDKNGEGDAAVTAKKDNRRLLKLLNEHEEDYPSCIKPNYACLDHDLEEIIKNKIGVEDYECMIDKYRKKHNLRSKKKAQKNPVIVSALLEELYNKGEIPDTLTEIVKKIKMLIP